MALGADRARILRLVLVRGLMLSGVGLLIGLVASTGLSRVLSALLYNVGPTDIGTLAGVSAIIGAAAVIACVIPAWRATRVDPLTVLRDA
jgi:ABC-type antimicrobial peptide transport system permease subunit